MVARVVARARGLRRTPEVQAINKGVLVLGLAVALCAPAGHARANGAFPDSQSVLTPADRPDEILLATNFGLVISEDGGTTWGWSCETDLNAFGFLYQLSPAPRHRLFVLSNDALAYSDDGTCGWQVSGGMLDGQRVADAFPDPTNADRVLAIGIATAGGQQSVFESMDGGTTFGAVIYTAATGDGVSSVEIARPDPRIVYVAAEKKLTAPMLARSDDSGGHWQATDLSGTLGNGTLRIIAIDPESADHVFLRFSGADHEAVAVTTDGGASVTTPLTIAGQLNAFARLPSGTLLVAATVNPGPVPTLYRSRDGGVSFDVVPGAPAMRALSVRGNVVYAAADNFGNGYALGSSMDEGDTWKAVMSYADVQAIIPCLKTACQMTCETEVTTGIWTDAVCSANLPPAGTGGAGAGDTGAGGAGGASAGGAGGHAPPASKGSGCSLAGDAGPTAPTRWLVAAIALLWCASRVHAARRR
jgi:hypothetical protein